MAVRGFDVGGMFQRSGGRIGANIGAGAAAMGAGLEGMFTGIRGGLKERQERLDAEKTAEKLAGIYSPVTQEGATSTQLFQAAQQLMSIGKTAEGTAMLEKARAMQIQEQTKTAETKEKQAEALRQGVLGSAYQAGVEGKPIEMLQGELSTFTSEKIGGKAPDFISMYESGVKSREGDKDKTEFGTTVTEWVSPTDPDKVVLKTIQPKGSPYPIVLGSNQRVDATALEGLEKKAGKPAVSVDLGEKTESAYAQALAKGVAELDLEILSKGTAAENNLSVISEARLVLEEPGNDITGFGAENITQVKSGMLSLMGAFGVSESDALYQKLSQETSAANLYNTFTQLFVRERMEATKGAITEREFDTFIASVPNLMQTAEGYKKVLSFMERANTAAVLKAQHIEKNMQTQKSVKLAKDEWSSFTRQFPLGSLSAEAMATIFNDFTKPNFSKDNMLISYIDPITEERVKQTYSEIAKKARVKGISPQLALKRMFDEYSAHHIPL